MTTIEFSDETYHVRLVIGPANVRRGMLRTLLQARSLEETLPIQEGMEEVEITALRFLREFLYPCLIAGVVSQEGFPTWPISFETFLNLPEPLEVRWEQAVFEENPHWRELPKVDQKKVTSTSDES